MDVAEDQVSLESLLLIALPTAILGAAFIDEIGDEDPLIGPGDERCPTCGKPVQRPLSPG